MMIGNNFGIVMNPAGARDNTQAKELADAAQKFEALLLNQLLSSAGDSESGGWLGTGEMDQAGAQAMQLAQQQFADTLAAQGGLGLSTIVIDRLGHQAAIESGKTGGES